MDHSHHSSFVSNTNHSTPSVPNTSQFHVRSLSHQPYQSLQSSRASFPSIPQFDYSLATPRLVSNDHSFVPALEFRVPLLPQTLHFAPDFQPNAPAIHPGLQSWYRSHLEEHVANNTRSKAMVSQPSGSATVSVPVSMPVTLPAALPLTLPIPPGCDTPTTLMGMHSSGDSPTTSPMVDQIPKRESPVLLLQDICHIDSPGPNDFADQSPIACHNPGLTLGLCSSNLGEKTPSEDPRALPLVASNWSPVSSLPSLSYGSFSGSENACLSPPKGTPYSDVLRLSLTPPLLPKFNGGAFPPPAMLGIFVDMNMREQALQEQSPQLCINPADVMSDSLRLRTLSPDLTATSVLPPGGPLTPVLDLSPLAGNEALATPSGRQLSPSPDYAVDFPDDALLDQEFPQEAISAIVSVLKSSTVTTAAKIESQESTNIASSGTELALSPQAFVKPCELVAPQPIYAQQGRVYPGSDLGILHSNLDTSTGSAAGPSGLSGMGTRIPLADIRIPQFQHKVPTYAPFTPAPFPSGNTYVFPPAPAPQSGVMAHSPAVAEAEPPSPVLNAHTGIPLEELRRRATDYRQRHHGAELDRSFLQSFAGRLSSRGELLEDYRCYVVGCGQRNKRRDHILVHVGSHVEHRPWACQHCGMRFLRKNECKRHESSHEGRKPYSCQICAPFQDRSFVRQDLLKRHLRVSHGVHDTGTRKKAQVKKDDADYWP